MISSAHTCYTYVVNPKWSLLKSFINNILRGKKEVLFLFIRNVTKSYLKNINQYLHCQSGVKFFRSYYETQCLNFSSIIIWSGIIRICFSFKKLYELAFNNVDKSRLVLLVTTWIYQISYRKLEHIGLLVLHLLPLVNTCLIVKL